MGGVALLAIRLCAKIGHLPFGILQGMCAVIFFQVGHVIKKFKLFESMNPIALLAIGIPSILLSYKSGRLGFSGCVFPNLGFNLLGALSIVLILYRMVKLYCNIAFIETIGQISILILGIHSADFLLDVSNRIEFYLRPFELPYWMNLRLIISIVIAIGGGMIISQIKFIRRIMSIKTGECQTKAPVLPIS